MHDVLGGFERELSLTCLVGRSADPNRNCVGGSADALEVAYQQRHKISRELLCRCEFQRVLVVDWTGAI